MGRVAWVQARDDGLPYNVNAYVAREGFTLRGFDVRAFTHAELPGLPLGREHVLHGTIGVVRDALAQIGAPAPPYLTLPTPLLPFAGRDVWETDLGTIRTLEAVPVFIKPLREGKGFTGHVVTRYRDLLETAGLPDDYPVLAQTPVGFLSEWRVFVCAEQYQGIGNYKGDPLVFPDPARIRAMLTDYTDAPAGFSLDVGVTDAGETLVVEVNDGYALGSYGLPPLRYSRLIQARWDEMAGESRP